jgi:hypothetical protein
MTRASRIYRYGILSVLVFFVPTAHASLITDSFQFQNPSNAGVPVEGTFTYDSDNPSTLVDLTLFMGDVLDATPGGYGDILPTFDGSELVGSFSITGPFLLTEISATFGPGATGDIVQTDYQNFGNPYFRYLLGSSEVSGQITYQLSGASTTGGSSVPLPQGFTGGTLALVVLPCGLCIRRRARALT